MANNFINTMNNSLGNNLSIAKTAIGTAGDMFSGSIPGMTTDYINIIRIILCKHIRDTYVQHNFVGNIPDLLEINNMVEQYHPVRFEKYVFIQTNVYSYINDPAFL